MRWKSPINTLTQLLSLGMLACNGWCGAHSCSLCRHKSGNSACLVMQSYSKYGSMTVSSVQHRSSSPSWGWHSPQSHLWNIMGSVDTLFLAAIKSSVAFSYHSASECGSRTCQLGLIWTSGSRGHAGGLMSKGESSKSNSRSLGSMSDDMLNSEADILVHDG